MHTVIEPACTGCELCIPVCPVDCIAMRPASGAATGWSAWSRAQADDSRRRYEARLGREAASSGPVPARPLAASPASKREAVAAAVARARAARAGA